jgi:hypothetical protein
MYLGFCSGNLKGKIKRLEALGVYKKVIQLCMREVYGIDLTFSFGVESFVFQFAKKKKKKNLWYTQP